MTTAYWIETNIKSITFTVYNCSYSQFMQAFLNFHFKWLGWIVHYSEKTGYESWIGDTIFLDSSGKLCCG
jgi:hypothetical protein